MAGGGWGGQPEGVEAHFIVASCENMVSAEAMRPGDILTASNGKTIEVINTDAGPPCGHVASPSPALVAWPENG